jgi:anti-sigma B factor antagonist
MSSLTTNIQQKINAAGQNEVTLALEGALDSSTVANFEAELTPVLAGKPTQMTFDLAGLKFVASAGIRLFFMAVQRQEQHGGYASFVHLQPQIKEVFDIMNSLPNVKIFRDQAELDAYLIARQKTHLEWQKSQRQ